MSAPAPPPSVAPGGPPLDVGRPVRPGEALDVGAVHRWLSARLPGLDRPPVVTQYAGGASNWTYRLEYPAADLVLRRPPAGTKAQSAHDMAREHRVQAALRPVFPVVPEMIGLCQDPSVLGCDFYVMRRIPGLIPRKELPVGAALDPARARALCRSAIDTLAALHRVDPVAVGLGGLGKGPGYPRRQIEGWSERYERARTWNVPSLAKVRAWLLANLPAEEGTSLVHGDFRLDNLVLDPADPTRIIGVLDWEMATIGDPLMDLGNSLAYWVEAKDDPIGRASRRQPTHLAGMLTRREVIEYYGERTGRRVDDFAFYEAYGLFRLAAIVQQIYYRYHHGQTRNPAFRRFWFWVHYLGWRCERVIARRGRG
jgi:aminoglycoside phosphotransferase (APT) family kinase protein